MVICFSQYAKRDLHLLYAAKPWDADFAWRCIPDPAAEVGAKNDACYGQHIGRTNHASPPGPLCPPPLQPQDPFPQLRHFESKFDHSGQERGQPGLQSHPSRHWLELPGRFQAVHWPNGQCGTWCVVWISSNTLLRSGQSFLLFSHNHLR